MSFIYIFPCHFTLLHLLSTAYVILSCAALAQADQDNIV